MADVTAQGGESDYRRWEQGFWSSSILPAIRPSSDAIPTSARSASIVLPWEYDCSLPPTDSSFKSSAGVHPFAAFLGSDDSLFSGLHSSVSKALKTVLLSADSSPSIAPNPPPLREALIQWRKTSSSEARIAEVVDALISITHDDASPLGAAVHAFMAYAATSTVLTDLERRLCHHLKDELYCNFSVLSLSAGPLPIFPRDSAGNIPCVKLIGVEFSSLKRLDTPRFLLIYSRSYLHIPDSPEMFTFIDVYDTVSCRLEPLLKTCCIAGTLVSASIDFSLKVLVCVVASEGLREIDDVVHSQESISSADNASLSSSAAASALYWLDQSTAAAKILSPHPEDGAASGPAAAAEHLDGDAALSNDSNSNSATSSELARGASLKVDVSSNLPPTSAWHAAAGNINQIRSDSCRLSAVEQFDYRCFVWTFRNIESKASPLTPTGEDQSPFPLSDDLQLEWYDEECMFPKTCNIISIENVAPILLRFRQEEFVQVGKIGNRVEKLFRTATEKDMRECVRLSLPALMLDQVFVDKPPPNRVLPCSIDLAPDGVIATRVLFYKWFPCECQLLVVSVLKSEKAHRAYDRAMREFQTPEFVPLAAIVRLFRLDVSVKKGRPALEQLLADVISIKWPNLAMQQRSRHEIAQVASPMPLSRSGSGQTPLSQGPETPSACPGCPAASSCVARACWWFCFCFVLFLFLFFLLPHRLNFGQDCSRFHVGWIATMCTSFVCACANQVR
jgi:hypothetical protein